jgi:putative ABC transport system permease protein
MKKFQLVIKLALKALFRNRGRSFLTMLGIIIGISSVIAIVALGQGAENLITGAVKKIGTDVITIIPGASDDKGPPASAYGIVVTTLTIEDFEALEGLPHVKYIAASVNGNGDISHAHRSTNGNFKGVTASYQEVDNHQVIQGRFFTQNEIDAVANVAVIGDNIKTLLFPLSDPIGEKIKIKNETFKIIGILERKGSTLFENPDNQVLVPLTTAQKKLLGYNHLNQIRIKVDSEENIDITTTAVQNILRYKHEITNPDNDDFSVRPLSAALETFEAISGGIQVFLALIAAVSLIVGGIGIMNIMLMTVTERTREIGLRKAIGAKPRDIKNQFILESIVLTVMGGIIGIILGFIITAVVYYYAINFGLDWKFTFPPSAAIAAVAVSIFIGLTFGVYPAKKAAKLNPIDALRYE